MRKKTALFLIFVLFISMLGTMPALADEPGGVEVTVDSTPISIVSMQAFTVRVELKNNFDGDITVILGGDSNYVPVEKKTVTLAAGEARTVYLYGTSYYPGAHSFRVTMKVGGDDTAVGSEILVNVADLPPEQQPPQPATHPQLNVSAVKFNPETPDQDEPFEIHLEITNKGTAEAGNVSVSFDGGSNFEVLDLVNRKDLGTVNTGTRTTASFRIRALKNRTSNTATVRITYRHDQAEQTITETLNLPLALEEPGVDKLPRLKSVTFMPSTPDVKGPFQVLIQFVNEGRVEARNFTVTLEGGSNFEVLDLTNRSHLGTVNPNSVSTATFRIRARDGRESNKVTVNASFYMNGKEETITETLNLPLGRVEQKEPEEAPYLKLGTFSVTPDNDNGDFTLNFQLQNLGKGAARRIAVRLDSSQAFPTESSNVMYVAELGAGSYTEFSLKMRVADKDKTVYSIPVTVTCADGEGAEFTSQENITFPAAVLGLKDDPAGGDVGTPRVMLGKYTLSESQILAGDTTTLTLYIENNSPKEVRNIKISLGVIQIGGETGGTVFSPVNSSNSFYVDRIPARQTYVHSVDLYVDPNAAAKTYIVPVEIHYEDQDARSYQVDELVNIPVNQESRLQVLAVEVPPMAMLGQPLPVTAEFVNVGKVALKNFLVSIEGDFHKENATYFLPSLEIGASDYFMGMIYPQAEGQLQGTVVFTYTDNTNKEVRIEKPFEVMVQPMVEPEFPGEFPEPGFPGEKPPLAERVKQNLKWLIPAILVLGGAVVLFVRKRRAARGEMFDESL